MESNTQLDHRLNTLPVDYPVTEEEKSAESTPKPLKWRQANVSMSQ